jgi:hypothetical protein
MDASAPISAHSALLRNPAASAIPPASEPRVAERRSIPLFHAASLFALGIAATQFIYLRPSWVLLALAPVAVVAAVAAFRAQRIAWLPLAAIGVLLGIWCAEMEPHPAPASQLAAASDGLLRTVEGTVVDAGPVRNEAESIVNEHNPEAGAPDVDISPNSPETPSQSIDLRVSTAETVTDTEDIQSPMAGGIRIRVSWPGMNGTIPIPFACGDRIRAVLRLSLPEVYHDPSVWSRQDYLLDQGITATGHLKVDRVERLPRSNALVIPCRLKALQHAIAGRIVGLLSNFRESGAFMSRTETTSEFSSAGESRKGGVDGREASANFSRRSGGTKDSRIMLSSGGPTCSRLPVVSRWPGRDMELEGVTGSGASGATGPDRKLASATVVLNADGPG